MIHEFSRTELLIGEEALGKLRRTTVLVLGVGGVGSHCIEALARSGVGRLILVDNDKVSLTNINRQSIAYHSTVGRYKTEIMKERIHDICPETEVLTYETFVLPENIEEIFGAKKEEIPLISCMGTGNKLHPELFEIADISSTSVCPLCKVMRKELKARGVHGVKVLYSKEKPVDVSGKETGEEKGSKRSLPGSISFTPPVAGLLIAGEAVREIIGWEGR